ncbi:MAG: putative nucleotide-diphospho-sugar transferase [Candidatus Babeliales bacterium]|jgi:Nucleotide-diphospho-sugar transferase
MNKKQIMFIILFFFNIYTKPEKMKLYAVYTPSHTVLKDQWFLPSIQDDFDLVIKFHNQTCHSASFMEKGWTKTTIKKVELIIQAVQENWGKIFIFSDVDIQFFGPIQKKIEQLMKNKDILVQKNSPKNGICSGFFACRGNEKTLQLWQNAYQIMLNNEAISDQAALSSCLKGNMTKNIAWDYLPDIFFGGGTLTGCHWTPTKQLPIPKNIIMHHANWTKGIRYKIMQLQYVRNEVKRGQNK